MAKKDTIATEAEVKPVKVDKTAKEDKKKNKKAAKATTPRRNRFKETFSELKKVSWPTFAKTMKNTGMVLSVVLIFGLLVFGLDTLVNYLINLIMGIK